jgi:hypothetical protein
MAYFAQLDDNNIVQQVISISNDVLNEPEFSFPETEVLGRAFISQTLGLPGTWKQTSFNGNIRKNYAGIGYTYDEQKDAFIPPKPFDSWTLNEDTCLWEPPIPYPADGKLYVWNEENGEWEEIS